MGASDRRGFGRRDGVWRWGAVLSALLGPCGTARAGSEVFVPYRYVDPATGLEAFHLLVPKGWKVEGGITWSANPALPAQSRFRFHDPRSGAEMNFFPTQSYFWTNNAMFLATNPPGTLRFGTPVAKPLELREAFAKVVIPMALGQEGGARIESEKPVPELAAIAKGAATPGVAASADAGKVRVAYARGGRGVEEEIYAAVNQYRTNLGQYFIDYWFIDFVFSFRAEKGRLDALAKTFQTMIFSLRANPRWAGKVANVKEALARQYTAGIKAVGRVGETVARAGSDMREDQLRQWEKTQAAKDRLVENFSDNIRGVERFHDPHADKEVELPAGYGIAWANNLGEYVVTDSPSYNPNVGSNLHWEPMMPVH